MLVVLFIGGRGLLPSNILDNFVVVSLSLSLSGFWFGVSSEEEEEEEEERSE